MDNNDNNIDNNEETISVEERNIFQDEFYPLNYEIQNNSSLNDSYNDTNIEINNSDNKEDTNFKNEDNKEPDNNSDSYVDNNIDNNNNVYYGQNNQALENNTYYEEEQKNNNISEKVANEDGKYQKKNIIIYFIVGVIIGLIILFVIMYINSGKTKIVNCSYNKKDDAYTETEEYTITYTGNNINYIEGVYTYKTIPENNKQLGVIREQKIPIIINSNGMDGFTHIFEIGDTIFKVYSYYDYEIMNFEKIEKNDSSKTPISYINIDSSKSYKKLKKDMENRGFKCINSK